jgi:hypothetical protein
MTAAKSSSSSSSAIPPRPAPAPTISTGTPPKLKPASVAPPVIGEPLDAVKPPEPGC